jgi:hypothetical protein
MSFWVVSLWDGEEEKELRCPKCGCPRIVFDETTQAKLDDNGGIPDYLGSQATCFECGHEFTVTGNCWETVCECD